MMMNDGTSPIVLKVHTLCACNRAGCNHWENPPLLSSIVCLLIKILCLFKEPDEPVEPTDPLHTHLALSQQDMYLGAFYNAMVFHIAWNRRTAINCPMKFQELVDNVQISLFTLQGNQQRKQRVTRKTNGHGSNYTSHLPVVYSMGMAEWKGDDQQTAKQPHILSTQKAKQKAYMDNQNSVPKK